MTDKQQTAETLPPTGFRLNAELLAKIDALAEAEHLSRSAWVRRALWQAVERAEK